MIHNITQQQLDETKPEDHRWRWPGVMGPGSYTWNEGKNRYEPISSVPAESSHDFSHSGLGIGGAGRHNLQDEVLDLVARGQMQFVERGRRGPMPNGQLWEPCPRCSTEPVCLDCGYCRNHCGC